MTRLLLLCCIMIGSTVAFAQNTKLLRTPDLNETQITFAHGGDIWVVSQAGGKAIRITSTPAVESNPTFSPDGKQIAFNSNRSGSTAVYTVSSEGGTPKRLTWYPSGSFVQGWTNDGENVLYATGRGSAPTGYHHLWTVPVKGGPSTQLHAQWATSGSFSTDGSSIVIDRMTRWDTEWRDYRGGQNTPLIILNLEDHTESFIPNSSSTDIKPLWLGDLIYFLSDRDGTANIWSFSPQHKTVRQITRFVGTDVKDLAGNDGRLIVEREGLLHWLNPSTGETTTININATGDFPWAETKWQDVSKNVSWSEISPTGKRAIMSARGEIFTVPVKDGDVRNLTKSSAVADRNPIWSPKGDKVAWFSDQGGKGYQLMIADQDGMGSVKSISIGESKMAWEPIWSPDGKHIAFVDDDVRVRLVDLVPGTIKTVDTGGMNLERGSMVLTWSPDSQWLAYGKTASNNFRQIILWSIVDQTARPITNTFADSFSPAFDRDGKHLYFLASTNLALGSGWANTSSIGASPTYAAYVVNLKKSDSSPFMPKSDEEEKVKDEEASNAEEDKDKKGKKKKEEEEEGADGESESKKAITLVEVDFAGIDRRIMALGMPVRNYRGMLAGPKGSVFVLERVPNSQGLSIHKFKLEDAESKEYLKGAGSVSISADGKKMLARVNGSWKVMDTSGPSGKDGKSLKTNLSMKLDRSQEWEQMFEEAWRYEQDYFYDPGMHGRDWDEVHKRYAPLIPHVKHRSDLTYILDQMNGELSVGHSFVFGGDYPETEKQSVGLLGADLVAENSYWKIERIFTTESWNPNLSSPLDRPGMKVVEGNYLVGVNGKEITATMDPYEALDGALDKQTILHLNSSPSFDGAWKETVKPIGSEYGLRQRAWVEDNRRKVDELSGGKLAYVWVPNTGGNGYVSFNRYFFAQQDKLGAVIDERFNGGGNLDDYMVDYMNRKLRAAITNEVPNGKPFNLPAGILGPKILLINELAGSGGDYFPWAFRQQKIGPLIGMRTWGGLVKSSVHYSLIDGGALTSPDNAVFDPINNKWVAENKGIAPDIEVRQDAKSLADGVDAQLERAVQETLKLLEANPPIEVNPPKFSEPAKN